MQIPRDPSLRIAITGGEGQEELLILELKAGDVIKVRQDNEDEPLFSFKVEEESIQLVTPHD